MYYIHKKVQSSTPGNCKQNCILSDTAEEIDLGKPQEWPGMQLVLISQFYLQNGIAKLKENGLFQEEKGRAVS